MTSTNSAKAGFDPEIGQTSVESDEAALDGCNLGSTGETSDDSSLSGGSPAWDGLKISLVLVILVGVFSSSLFLVLGIKAARVHENDTFERRATELTSEIAGAWNDYERSALWIHQGACNSRNTTYREFRELYEHLISNGLGFQVASCAFNFTDAEREKEEARSRSYFGRNYPDLNYSGFRGLEPVLGSPGALSVTKRSRQPFYFPVHLLEPIEGNEAAVDFDLYSSASRRETIKAALTSWKPTLTPRLRLVQETDPSAYSVILMHPGIPVSTIPNQRPRDLATLVVRIPDLLRRATRFQVESLGVYIFESPSDSVEDPVFLGGISIHANGEVPVQTFLEERQISEVRADAEHIFEKGIEVASNKEWTVVVIPVESNFEDDLALVIIAGAAIFVACIFISFMIYFSIRRESKMAEMKRAQNLARINQIESNADAEKSALLAETARSSLKNERALNDFIAHEVRNPLSAAMSALSFVQSEISVIPPLADETSRKSVEDDLGIIERSLSFINDLLRSMLDLHRASSNQMTITKGPTDLRKDVFEPVASMLYCRGEHYTVEIQCPPDLMVSTDRLRLTQVVLNLGRNAAKFVSSGYIRLCAEVIDGNVRLFIEDSGPGIPEEKRNTLFAKFQESLDTLNQGTGIGLSLCEQLVGLMEGDLWLDQSFDSGIDNSPGARFVVDLNEPPLQLDTACLDAYESTYSSHLSDFPGSVPTSPSLQQSTSGSPDGSLASPGKIYEDKPRDLPEGIKLLLVDDDPVVRKLFMRSIKRAAATWEVFETSSGEAALAFVEESQLKLDLILMDQYMASTVKQLLGTETVAALRAKGVNCRICGLSANDMEDQFLKAGADFFIMKPIPTNKDAMVAELCRLLSGNRHYVPRRLSSGLGRARSGSTFETRLNAEDEHSCHF